VFEHGADLIIGRELGLDINVRQIGAIDVEGVGLARRLEAASDLGIGRPIAGNRISTRQRWRDLGVGALRQEGLAARGLVDGGVHIAGEPHIFHAGVDAHAIRRSPLVFGERLERGVLVDEQVFVIVASSAGQRGRVTPGSRGFVERGRGEIDRVGSGGVVVNAVSEAMVRGLVIPEPGLESSEGAFMGQHEAVSVGAIFVLFERAEHRTRRCTGADFGFLVALIVVRISVDFVFDAPAGAEFGFDPDVFEVGLLA